IVPKAAIFVEGMTEVVFVKRLLQELAGAHHCIFVTEEYRSKGFIIVETDVPGGQKFEFLIVDCGSDSSVLTAILDRHAGLATSGYNRIYGLRDLYPLSPDDLEQIDKDIQEVLPAVNP